MHSIGLNCADTDTDTDTVKTLTDGVYGLNASYAYDGADRLKSVTRSGDAQSFG